jgi:hypothetical protein
MIYATEYQKIYAKYFVRQVAYFASQFVLPYHLVKATVSQSDRGVSMMKGRGAGNAGEERAEGRRAETEGPEAPRELGRERESSLTRRFFHEMSPFGGTP